MNIPFIYKKLFDRFGKKTEVTTREFKTDLRLFRLTNKDWYNIALEMQKQGLIKFSDYGVTTFNNRKIKILHKKV